MKAARRYTNPPCPQNPEHGPLLDWPTDRSAWYCPNVHHAGSPFYTTDLGGAVERSPSMPDPKEVSQAAKQLVAPSQDPTTLPGDKLCRGLVGRPEHTTIVEHFGKDAHRPDGLAAYCKECMTAYRAAKRAPSVSQADVDAVVITPDPVEPTAEQVEADIRARRAAQRRAQRAAKREREAAQA